MIPTIAGVLGTPLYNSATGGTITTFTYGGKLYRRHMFTTAGAATFTVLANPQPFRVTMIAGSATSGYSDAPTAGGWPGGSGGGYYLSTALPTGSITLQVGARDSTSATSDTVFPGLGTCGGGGQGEREFNRTGRTDGRPGTWGGTSTGGNGLAVGQSTPNDPSASFRTLIDGTTGSWGRYADGVPSFAGGYNHGNDGMVCIEYVIG